MKSIAINIDGKIVKVKEGTTILEAARNAGIAIPTLCYDEKLAPYGGCRLCTVEIVEDKRTRLVASCMYPVQEGLVVKTKSERVNKIRKMILELILPSAPTGPVESMARQYGLKASRFEAERNFCALCGLCVRYCAEIKGANAIFLAGRGIDRQVSFVPGIASKICPVCRECLPLCPGGMLPAEIENLLVTPNK